MIETTSPRNLWFTVAVGRIVSAHTDSRRSASWLITVGAALFIGVLAVSAAFDASLRGLHLVQAAIYLATILLVIRGNRWGCFLGISAAAFWDYVLLFVSPIPARFVLHPTEPDLLLQAIGWIANVLVIIGSVGAYLGSSKRSLTDLARLAVAFALATGILAGGAALFSPQRLSIFAQALHPHWP